MADEVREVHKLSGHSGGIWSVAFSTDGKWLATGSWDKTVKLWNPATGECVRTCTGHVSSVFSVAFSEDGKWVASASGDKTARVWDKETGRCTRTCAGHSSHVCAVAISADGGWLASGSYDKTVRLWNPATGEYLRSCAGLSSTVLALAFSADGALLASGCRDTIVRLWNPAMGALVCACKGHSGAVRAVTFAKSGKLLASGSEDKTMRLWDAASGACLRTFGGHSNAVCSVAFSPDGKWLASGSEDTSVRLWDPESNVCVRIIDGHFGKVYSVAFSPDGKWLASGSGGDDKAARLWDVSSLNCGGEEQAKADSQFFACLAECNELELDAYEALDKLWPLVREVSELKLLYTFASAALRKGDITAGQRKRFVSRVLEAVTTNIKFDQGSEVVTTLTRTVLPACERDGMIDGRERERLAHEFMRVNVFADYRYRRLEETVALHSQQLGALQGANYKAHKRINDVGEYASAIDRLLQKFKLQNGRHLENKSTSALVSGLISMIPFAGSALKKALDGLVDLSSVAEVMSIASSVDGGCDHIVELIQDQGGRWAERPLQEAVREHHLRAPEVAVLGMIQMMNAMDNGAAVRELQSVVSTTAKGNGSRSDTKEGVGVTNPTESMRDLSLSGSTSEQGQSSASEVSSQVMPRETVQIMKRPSIVDAPAVTSAAARAPAEPKSQPPKAVGGISEWKAAFNEMCAVMEEKELDLDVAATVALELLGPGVTLERINAVLLAKDIDKSGTCNIIEFVYVMKELTRP